MCDGFGESVGSVDVQVLVITRPCLSVARRALVQLVCLSTFVAALCCARRQRLRCLRFNEFFVPLLPLFHSSYLSYVRNVWLLCSRPFAIVLQTPLRMSCREALAGSEV